MGSAPSPRSAARPLDPGRRFPPVGDAVLAVGLAVADVVQVVLTPDVDRSAAVLISLSLLTTLPIAWRRTATLPAALLWAVFFLLLLTGDYPDFLVGTLAAAVIISYSVGLYVDSLAAGTLTISLINVAGWIDDVRLHHPPGQFLASAFLLTVPWALARIVRAQQEQAARLEELTRELELQRDQTARAAVTEERNRIARELHDLVAHAISVIAVQSAGAESALGDDSEEARRPLKLIQRTSREALLEMRRMLKVLRGSPAASGDPQPGIDDIPKLIEDAEAAGTSVSLDLTGDSPVPRTVDMNAYRIVQECLTNVRKHAGPGAGASVVVLREPSVLRIVVRDDGVGMREDGDRGHGLLGIRERARLFGGKMTAADADGRGFVVQVELPLGPDLV
jgi:signal transduction histidine kinase